MGIQMPRLSVWVLSSNRYLCFLLPSRENSATIFFIHQLYSRSNKSSSRNYHKTKWIDTVLHICSFGNIFCSPAVLSSDWQLLWGWAVGSSLCLCCSYVLSLIYPTYDLWVRVNVQDVSSNTHNGPPFIFHRRTERGEEKDERSLRRQTITLSLHRFPSSVWAEQAIQTQPTSSYNYETLCLPPFSQTNPLSPHPPALQDQVVHCVWTCAKVHWERPAAQSMSNKLQHAPLRH